MINIYSINIWKINLSNKRIYHEQMDEYFRDLISQSISKIRRGRRNSSKDAAKVGKRKEISANFIDGDLARASAWLERSIVRSSLRSHFRYQ